jgi:hypothetical protein
MLGFWTNDVNPFGPVHEYEVMPFGRPVKFNALPAQTGLLLVAVGVGKSFTINCTALDALVQAGVPEFPTSQ